MWEINRKCKDNVGYKHKMQGYACLPKIAMH